MDTSFNKLSGTQALVSNGAQTLSWQTTVTNVIGTANEITVTNPTTTPTDSIANTYVGQASITTLGTIGAGIWNGTPVTVPYGGTGIDTTTAYGVLCGGTTATNPLQNPGAGTANQAFISNGAAALPTWQSINASKAQANYRDFFNCLCHSVSSTVSSQCCKI